MKNIKQQLAQKVDTISNYSVPDESNDVEVDNRNIIDLNPQPQNQTLSVVPEFAITIMDAKSRIEMLQSFVREMMVPNVDYGLIPKCDKPSLFKSGAEKLCDIFGFSKRVEVLNRIENWETGVFHYEVKISLYNKRTGHIEAEGIGSCNNQERKYKNQDSFSIVNTILKMAKKRALIDAVLSATRSSGMFTQDIEDEEPHQFSEKQFPLSHQQQKLPKTVPASDSQLKFIYNLVSINRIPINTVKNIIQSRYSVTESKLLSNDQASDLISYLKNYSSDRENQAVRMA